MLNRLAKIRNVITLASCGVLLVLWLVTLIFGKSDDKVVILVLTLILPSVVYGFVHLLFKIIQPHTSTKVLHIGAWFFLVCGTIGTAMMLAEFVNGFPDGLSPTLGACLGMVVGVLAVAKKNVEDSEK